MQLVACEARGGTAEIWSVAERPDAVAKLARSRHSARAALAAEAVALTALRGTGTVELRGVHEVDGRHLLLLEKIDGPSLAAWGERPLAARANQIGCIADVLAAIHAAGWVHGDVKPANVIVADRDGRSRLIDLGAATPVGRPTPGLATSAYVAPERLRSSAADPAADVYSLGVLAFELLTGAVPFERSGRAAELAHGDRRVPFLPAPLRGSSLERVVRACLTKEPSSRPTAAEVARVARDAIRVDGLEHLDAVPNPGERGERPRLARGTRPRPRGRATRSPAAALPLCGRDHELATIVATVEAAANRRRLCTIIAPAGVGKSALLAAARGAVAAQVVALDGSRALATAVGSTASADGQGDEAALRYVLAGGAAPLAAAAPGALWAAASRAIAATLAPASVIMIDDAHAADPLLLDAVDALLADPRWRGTVIAAGRPSLLQTRPRWGHGAEQHTVIELGPLDLDGAAALVRAAAPELLAVPRAVVAALVGRVGGTPLVLVELLRRLRASGRLARGEDGAAALLTDALDDAGDGDVVAGAVQAELDRLSPELADVARVLAVAGDLDAEDRQAVLDHPRLALELDGAVAVSRLCRAGLITVEGGRVQFRHDLVRAAVAATVAPSQRAEIHAVILDSARSLGATAIAHHTEGAGGDAAAAWREVAIVAERRHDYLTAESAATKALRAGATEIAVLQLRGRVRIRLGHHQPALDDFHAAMARCDDVATRARLGFELATALDWLARFDESSRHAAAAAALIAEGDHPAELVASIEMARGRAAWRQRAFATARDHLEAALAVAAPLPFTERYEVAIASHLMLGWVLPACGADARARDHLDQAEVLAVACGDLAHQAAVANNRYAIHAAAGELALARATLAKFTALANQLGLDVIAHRAHYNEAIVACWCGDDELASRHAAVAFDFERGAPRRFPRPRATLLLAALALRAGDRQRAIPYADRAAAALSAITAEPWLAGDRLLLAAITTAIAGTLDRAAAQALADQAIAHSDSELAFEIFELAARVSDHDRGALFELARRYPPALPRLLTQLPIPGDHHE